MRAAKNWTKVVGLSVALGGVLPLVGADLPGVGMEKAHAEVVSRISVTGSTRVEPDTVISYLTIQPGRNYTAADVDESIKTLFATGLFSDVRISRSGNTLVVAVVENPVITRVAFEGNDRHDDKILAATIELQPRSVLTQAKVQSDTQRILELYRRTGRYNATVEPQVIDLGENRVDLVFKINEGPRTEVNRISFVGNKAFSDGRLGDVIQTKESGILGWLRSTDNYDPDRLNADQELLRRFYYSRGYADFRIVSAVADFDREQNAFFITFTVEEGEQYTFGDINVESTLSEINPEELRALATTKPGDVYNATAVEETLEDITVAVAARGYAFVQVRPRGDRDYANRRISVTYFVDEGARAYVERINVIGNTRTRDYVIRREFDLAEGDAFNQVLIEKAERRLRNLGYFKTVRVFSEPGSSPDRVIVNVQVEDQPTGEVSIGAGYSTANGFIAELSLSEKNFLGRGQYVRAAVGRGEEAETYELSFTEPYFLDRRLSAGFDLYRRSYDEGSGDVHPYEEVLTGGALRFGIPVAEDTTLGLKYSLYNQEIFGIDDEFTDEDGIGPNLIEESETLVSSIGYTLTYDTIDSRLFPRDGIFAQFGQEFAGVGGDVQFLRTTAKADYYKEIIPDWGMIGHVGVKAGHIMGIGQDLRFVDHFRLGGETIRGFASEGIGPRDDTSGYLLGGQLYAAATAETIFPIPVVPREFGFYGSLFADAGTVWDVDQESVDDAGPGVSVVGDDPTLRASVGLGLLWQSPFGLLRADFALPVSKDDADETQIFRFSGGTKF
ncbi:outer membrane protein assembly factor BamA [Chthonobacter rhizosphaerae]|uniref:outer membrane protein assembly factor BamA n=1 Tax=Chthonobacter rhizosphaerae TaxID=2735553 RepID=UPI0015EE4A13|nr:outer membrane protein assembly factor BamA [Chthonobacter rhizosphaerae]